MIFPQNFFAYMRERQKQKCKKGMRYFEVCVWFFHKVPVPMDALFRENDNGVPREKKPTSHAENYPSLLPASSSASSRPSWLFPTRSLRFLDPSRSDVQLPDLQTRLSVNPFHSYRRKRGSASQKISRNSISPTFYIIHENWASGFLAEPHTHTSLRHDILSHVIFARIMKIFSNI